MSRKATIFAIFLLVLTSGISARLSVEKARNTEGISNNAILNLLQDRMGYIWMGSYDGLNRYDGKRVDVFRFELDNPHGLSGNVIGGLLPAGGDNIWVLTSMGLDLFDTRSLRTTASFPEIRADRQLMASDTLGNAFVLSPDGILSHLDPLTMKFARTPVKNLPAYKDVKKILLDGMGRDLLIICNDGTIRSIAYDFAGGHKPGKARFNEYSFRIHDIAPEVIIPGSDGFYYVDRKGALLYYMYEGRTIRKVADLSGLPFERISGIARMGNDMLIGFFGIGTGRLIGRDGNRFEMLSSEVGTFDVMTDRRQPLVWCATDGRGLYKIYDSESRYHSILSANIPGLSKPIRCFHTDSDGNLWIGSKGDGLFRIKEFRRFYDQGEIPDGAIERFDERNGLPDNQIFAMANSRRHPGRKWIGSRGPGISYVTPDGRITTLRHPGILDIHDIFEQNDSVLWLASTTRGLIRAVISSRGGKETIEPGGVTTFEFRHGPYVCNEIHSMVFDGKKTLYIGCRGGLGVVRFDLSNYRYGFLSEITDRFPAIGDVICLFYSKEGKLYFGSSAGAGILDFRNSKSAPVIITHKDGMINDMAHSVIPDRNGHVWISTNKGLVRYDPENSQLHNVTDIDGALVEYCDNAGFIAPDDGNIFFGAINGFVRISGEIEGSLRTENAPFYFSAIQVNGRDRNLHDLLAHNGKITLPSDENNISISFAALDYIKGEDFNYYYRLKGYSDEWVNLGTDPSVTFASLPPGRYILEVTYRGDGIVSPSTPYELPITIRQPWYFSTAAIIIYILLISAGIFLAIYFTRKFYRKKRREFENTLYTRQQEQLYADRMEFFQNITHELCTPLTMIMGLCNRLHNSVQPEHNEKLNRYIDSMQRHSSHLNDLIQEILEIRKMQQPDFHLLRVQPISLENIFEKWVYPFKEIATANGIDFETSLEQPDLRWNTDASAIGKIITNLISNALKYTPEKGAVKIDCKVADNILRFSVYNTGEGISPEEQKTLFDKFVTFRNADRNGYSDMASRHGLGLYICRGLVEQLQGTISVDSRVGEYTRFSVELPHLEISEKEPTASADCNQEADVPDAEGKSCVLVVDDNPDILWLVGDILSDKYDVVKASGADEAFAKINKRVPSLIITDIMMPGTDGIAFTAKLRENRYTKNTPVLILSAKLTESHKIDGYSAGADEYMTKPFSPEFLRVVVERMINRKKSDKDYYHSSESAVTLHEGMEVTNEDKEFFDRLKRYIADNIEDENRLKPADLAAAMGMEVRTLYRKFKKASPYTPTEFVKNYRYGYAAQLLRTTNLTIQEIIYKVGVSNKTVFYADFKKIYGMTPKEYRDAGASK